MKNYVPPMVGTKSSSQVVLFLDNKDYTVLSKDPRFGQVFDMIRENKNNPDLPTMLKDLLDVDPILVAVQRSNGKIELRNDGVYYGNEKLHGIVVDKIMELWNDDLPVDSLIKFLDKLMSNPRKHVVDELYKYLEKNGLPITEDGDFLSYKKVGSRFQSRFKDKDGTEVLNTPGTTVKMRRNAVDDDDNRDCSYGLHAGAMSYVTGFSVEGSTMDRVIVVAINPANVVTVPYADCSKLRTCEYTVLYELKDFKQLENSLYTNQGEAVPSNRTVFADPDWDSFEDDLYDYDDYEDEDYYEVEQQNVCCNVPKDNIVEKPCCKGNDNWKKQKRDKFGRFI